MWVAVGMIVYRNAISVANSFLNRTFYNRIYDGLPKPTEGRLTCSNCFCMLNQVAIQIQRMHLHDERAYLPAYML